MLHISLGDSFIDAKLIILQIVLMQTCNYFLLILLCILFCIPFGFTPTIEQLFSYKAISVFSLFGWINILIWLTDGIIGGLLLFLIVRRSKKCLDFTITFHLIHFIGCIIYKSFPIYWEWYCCILLHAIIMIIIGEISCYWREKREILLTSNNSSSVNDDDDEEDVGNKL
ncbi:hypothetical protein ABK040_013506 [Willaertia magna]